jgi:protein involved in polysaccharide export with SLBB domain
MTSQRLLRAMLAAPLLLSGASALAGCRSDAAVDRRILQVLNQQGFGRRYTGRAQEQNYVTIGDTVTFADLLNPEVRGSEIVAIDGTIELPSAGPVFVAGLTRRELETYLSQKLAPFFTNLALEISLRSGGAKVYYVVGEVELPGPKLYRGDTTVFEAVQDAMPNEYTANLGRVRVIRADPQNPLVIQVNVAELWESGDSTYNVQLQEFDVVYVPPTLLKQFADVLSGILVPLVTPFRAVLQAVFFLDRGGSRFDRRVF